LVLLSEQFQRLAERNIAVYWAGGRVDPPDGWPPAPALPQNVQVFPKGTVEEITHVCEGEPLATIVGSSFSGHRKIRTADFRPDPSGQFTVAVAYGSADADSLPGRQIGYWALGGEHRRVTLSSSPCVAHYPGTPQGRSPADPGPLGCTLVDVDADGQVGMQLVPADAIRWFGKHIELASDANRDDLYEQLRDRLRVLIESASGRDVLVSWRISTSAPLAAALRRGGTADELIEALRREFGHGKPAGWTVSLTLQAPVALPDHLYDEDTILGDFLRAVRDRQEDESQPIDFGGLLSHRQEAGTISTAVQLRDKTQRRAVLQQVAVLGVDLLGGEEAVAVDGPSIRE